MRIASKTDKGLKRESNQDAFATLQLANGAVIAIVCDGMGGANGGNVASDTAVRILSEQLANAGRDMMGSRSIKAMLQSAVFAANIAVFDLANANESLHGMGTTVVAAVLYNHTAHIAHAGDSRAYVLRTEGGLSQITRDHSIVQHMLESGQLTSEEAQHHPKRNVITRAVGVCEAIDVEYDEIDLEPGDILLLCSDGLTNYVSDEQIAEILKSNELSAAVQLLIDFANKNGGGDNITAVAVAG